MSDDDWLPVIFASPILLSIFSSVGLGIWGGLRTELADRGLIASPGTTIIEVPGWEGAGLGGVHVVVLSCAIVTAMVITTLAVEQRRLKTIDTEGWGGN